MPSAWIVLVIAAWSSLRIAEFALSEHNMGALLAAGGVERCDAQHRWLLMVNAAIPLLAVVSTSASTRAPWAAVPIAVSLGALAVLVAAECLHWWAIATMGRRWTTGVLVIPGEAPVRRGPYRRLRHPGYLGGATSGALLPLVAGAWPPALVAAAMIIAVVVVRVRCEDAAWATLGATASATQA